MIGSLLTGFATAITLICAIGAQNAFVLRQGLRAEHVVPVVITCVASDVLLISVGVAGLGVAAAAHPTAITVIRWSGAAFLLGYALFAIGRALRPGSLTPADQPPASLGVTLLACLAFTYLNPHTYIDTVLILGTVANSDAHRWLFTGGAALASATWFTALGAGARRLAPLLAKTAAWRVLDAVIAAVMIVIAVALVRA